MRDREAASFFHTYDRIPLEIERGDGVYLYTRQGNRYLDLFAGYAVNALGYGHPGILRAIREQSERYLHISNSYLQTPQVELAELLLARSGYRRVFFSNSGTEAIEAALKIARRWGAPRGKEELIGFSNAFHGRTLGALSIMDRKKYREGFGPFLEGCRTLPFNDPGALRSSLNPRTAAVVLECLQGEGGVVPAREDFIGELVALRKEWGFLVITDEIQSGMGRTGRLFSFQHTALVPDMVVLAKALGGGLPLGAVLGSEALSHALEPGLHGSTFGGNPVACAAGTVVLTEVSSDGFLRRVTEAGTSLLNQLEHLRERFPRLVREVRGKGLMLGMELTVECRPFVDALREKGVLLNCTNQNVLRFLPPLVIGDDHIREAVEALGSVLEQFNPRS